MFKYILGRTHPTRTLQPKKLKTILKENKKEEFVIGPFNRTLKMSVTQDGCKYVSDHIVTNPCPNPLIKHNPSQTLGF